MSGAYFVHIIPWTTGPAFGFAGILATGGFDVDLVFSAPGRETQTQSVVMTVTPTAAGSFVMEVQHVAADGVTVREQFMNVNTPNNVGLDRMLTTKAIIQTGEIIRFKTTHVTGVDGYDVAGGAIAWQYNTGGGQVEHVI